MTDDPLYIMDIGGHRWIKKAYNNPWFCVNCFKIEKIIGNLGECRGRRSNP